MHHFFVRRQEKTMQTLRDIRFSKDKVNRRNRQNMKKFIFALKRSKTQRKLLMIDSNKCFSHYTESFFAPAKSFLGSYRGCPR